MSERVQQEPQRERRVGRPDDPMRRRLLRRVIYAGLDIVAVAVTLLIIFAPGPGTFALGGGPHAR